MSFSLLAFTGAAQIAAFDLLGADSPLPEVIGTAVLINLRFVMYALSLPICPENPSVRGS